MILSLKPYPAYKDSGTEWLGQVPVHWEVRRLKHWVRINERVLPESAPVDYEFDYLDIGNVGTGRLVSDAQRLVFGNAPSRARRIIRQGDTILSTVRTYLKAVYFVSEHTKDLVASTGFAVLTPSASTEPKFVSYVAQSDFFTNQVTAESVGIAYPSIAESRLASIQVAVPSLPEQTAIVRFLDHVDRRIRHYIRAKQKLIKLLEEYKQALIHCAVTGRIDVRTGQPYPAYKPSGVEWLGEVPAHWEVTHLGRLAQSFKTGPFGSVLHQSDYVSGGIPLINPIHLSGGRIEPTVNSTVSEETAKRLREYALEPGDIVFARRGELGRCALVRDEHAGWLLGTGSLRMRPLAGAVNLEYLMLALGGAWVRDYLSLMSIGATMQNLNTSILAKVPLLLPSAMEQNNIFRFVHERGAKTDSAIAAAQREIELLREFRTRLIADVVTGKLNVREAAARLPEEAEEPEALDKAEALAGDGEDEEDMDLGAIPEEVGA